MLPVLALMFAALQALDPSLPVYGVLANVLAEPAAPFATVIGLVACLLATLVPPLAGPVARYRMPVRYSAEPAGPKGSPMKTARFDNGQVVITDDTMREGLQRRALRR